MLSSRRKVKTEKAREAAPLNKAASADPEVDKIEVSPKRYFLPRRSDGIGLMVLQASFCEGCERDQRLGAGRLLRVRFLRYVTCHMSRESPLNSSPKKKSDAKVGAKPTSTS